jgi:hypothetical protein
LFRKNVRGAAILTSVTVLNWKHQNNSNVLTEKGLAIGVNTGDSFDLYVRIRPFMLGFCTLGASYTAQRVLILNGRVLNFGVFPGLPYGLGLIERHA